MAKRRMDAVDALKLAIERQRGANKFYRQAADMTEDPNGERAFKWLAKEELRHLAKLRQQLRSVLANNRWLKWRRATTPIERREFPSPSEATVTVKVGAGERDALRRRSKRSERPLPSIRRLKTAHPTSMARPCSERWPGRRRGTWHYWRKSWSGSPNPANTSRSTGSPCALISRPS
ncbi:MAG: ferritin family protein [Dehalococcoidia bacterium]